MSIDLEDSDLLALASAFVTQGDTINPCKADSIEFDGENLLINYSWGRGSSEWYISPVNLMAWAWNNPKAAPHG